MTLCERVVVGKPSEFQFRNHFGCASTDAMRCLLKDRSTVGFDI